MKHILVLIVLILNYSALGVEIQSMSEWFLLNESGRNINYNYKCSTKNVYKMEKNYKESYNFTNGKVKKWWSEDGLTSFMSSTIGLGSGRSVVLEGTNIYTLLENGHLKSETKYKYTFSNDTVTREDVGVYVEKYEKGKEILVLGIENNEEVNYDEEEVIIYMDPFHTKWSKSSVITYRDEESITYKNCYYSLDGVSSYEELIPDVILGKWKIKYDVSPLKVTEFDFLNMSRVKLVKEDGVILFGKYKVDKNSIAIILDSGEELSFRIKFESTTEINFLVRDNNNEYDMSYSFFKLDN